jgi:FkbM family methyltransferase
MEGRAGDVVDIDGLSVFVAEDYGRKVKNALRKGGYERIERELAPKFLTPGDRVLELGTAIGVIAMTAARIVGAPNVRTYDANPEMIADAKANFARNGLGDIDARVGLCANRRQFVPGEAEFGIDVDFWASRATGGNEDGFVRRVSAPRFCLEDEIEAFGANVLICDIEGGEVELLNGADLSALRLLILETHYWAKGEAAIDAMMRELILTSGLALHLEASARGVMALRRPG